MARPTIRAVVANIRLGPDNTSGSGQTEHVDLVISVHHDDDNWQVPLPVTCTLVTSDPSLFDRFSVGEVYDLPIGKG